jgi:hypothetical protein
MLPARSPSSDVHVHITNDQSRSIMEEAGPTPKEALELEKTVLYLRGWKLWLLTAG